jgi:6-phosphogluconolactonase
MRLKSQLDRRRFLGLFGVGAAVPCLALGTAANPTFRHAGELLLFVGTYTSGGSKSEGIYIFKLDTREGTIFPHKVIGGVEEPSFLALDTDRKFLYAVNETLDYQGKKSGAVSSFSVDRKSGSLTFLNKQPSMGGAPCHLSVSRDGKFVLVANYIGGNVAVLPVRKDGSLGEALDLEQHSGSGPDKSRQEAAHAHSVSLDQNDRFAFVNDLGIDRVMIYEFDAKGGSLTPNSSHPYYQTKSGAGPRHFTFHPTATLAFVINELDMTISSLRYDRSKGALKEIQTVSTIPVGFSGENTCADIHVTPNGRFLYGSNRGHDSLAAFRIDSSTGRMDLIGHYSTKGKTPRNFCIDPTGAFLLVANQRSDSIVTFAIDPGSGELCQIGNIVTVPSPVCLKLI